MPDDVQLLGCEPVRILDTQLEDNHEHSRAQGQCVHANGIDIHYLDQGEGEPLVLLHGGVVSTNPIWTGVPVAYAGHMDTLAERFRVIAPDTRGVRPDRA